MQLREKYKYLFYAITLNILLCSCSEKVAGTQNIGKHINMKDVQGYWESNRLGFPVNIDEGFKIKETGSPAPTGRRNSLQYYLRVIGNDVECYVKCIFDAYFPNANENPVYTILLNRDYSISVEKGYKVHTNIFENMSYYVCPNCNEKHSIYGESHIDEIAAKYGIQTVAKLPMDSEVAKSCDRGMVECLNTDNLKAMVTECLGAYDPNKTDGRPEPPAGCTGDCGSCGAEGCGSRH